MSQREKRRSKGKRETARDNISKHPFTLTPDQFLQNNMQNANIIVFFFLKKCISLFIIVISYYFNSRAFIVPSIGIKAPVCYKFCLFQPLIHVKCTYPSQFTVLFVWNMCIPYFSHLLVFCSVYKLQKQWKLKMITLFSSVVLFIENTMEISVLIQRRSSFLVQHYNRINYLFLLIICGELLSVKLCRRVKQI